MKNRRSIRLKGYDYSQDGAYFITLCTQNRECLFGDIVNDAMGLNEFGTIILNTWEWLENQYGYVHLDEYVIMPNHFHGILVINHDECGDVSRRGGSRTAPTMPIRTAPSTTIGTATTAKPIGRLIGAFKTVSTKQINQIRQSPGTPIWQRNYYEHIIHTDDELNRIQEYIQNNPKNWGMDRENNHDSVCASFAHTAEDFSVVQKRRQYG